MNTAPVIQGRSFLAGSLLPGLLFAVAFTGCDSGPADPPNVGPDTGAADKVGSDTVDAAVTPDTTAVETAAMADKAAPPVNTTGPMPPAGVYGPCTAACGAGLCITPPAYGGTGSVCSTSCMAAGSVCPEATGVTGMGICVIMNACVVRCETTDDCYRGGYCDMGIAQIGKICVYP